MAGKKTISNRNKKGPVRRNSKSCRVRMYRHGLGDCFLLSFPKGDGGEFHVLIDCGLIAVAQNPKQKMIEVAESIAKTTGGILDLVVLTHEHWDHASGFSEQQAKAVFEEKLKISQVWYAWTEDPASQLGQKLRRERELKARAAHRAVVAMGLSPAGQRMSSLLSFLGMENAQIEPIGADRGGTIGKVRKAFDYVGKRKDVEVRYCHPNDPPALLAPVDGVRVYVLGPPENETLIKRSDPTARGKEVYELAPGFTVEGSLLAAFSRRGKDTWDIPQHNVDCPFDSYLQRQPETSTALKNLVSATWNAPGEQYRQIDADWMNVAESIALALDKHTNNTSLVLAFELVETGRVLLFAADAQVGNWLSWQDLSWSVSDGSKTFAVTGPDLLRRTILYKVGHHGSHNATLRDKGLEQMESRDLMALVPVNKQEALKNRWTEMPFEKLVHRLREKTRGRLIFSDSELPTELDQLTAQEQTAFKRSLRSTALYHEVEVPM